MDANGNLVLEMEGCGIGNLMRFETITVLEEGIRGVRKCYDIDVTCVKEGPSILSVAY